ncbi:glutamate racemase [Aestuariirhabdus sp. Z084]|uniref:glutamate racemase n=1 Tax=Aestuariirhabdus haliotis TaxID=2918751 RepID=UPI00201B3C25|nr:glutamate racemase [Aestuariirhabdus haliotis]MCL6416914.1 glutamate racemase [Aestuariirhabdus haliotis]MCL6420924.1 glutamate racemase [Aestuariirhabdus haliotis]
MTAQQILIFDSGVGGLSIYREILNATRGVDCHYLFDNAFYPYGELDDQFLVKRLLSLLDRFCQHQRIDLIVIACNSASTVALEALRKHLKVPVVGVVPAIKPAAQLTQNGIIGLLATPATVKRDYTAQLIRRFAPAAQVLSIGSTELVALAEQKMRGLPVTVEQVRAQIAPWMDGTDTPDTLVLGCTHFPLLGEEIAGCFDRPVHLVDSGAAIANRVLQLLKKSLSNTTATHFAYCTRPLENSEHAGLTSMFSRHGFQALQVFASSGDGMESFGF